MNLQQARSILNVSEESSDEEIKKAYRQAAKENHPDINKALDAEKKIKDINEAYQVLTSGQSTDPVERGFSWGGTGSSNPFRDAFFQQAEQRIIDNIAINTSISFIEAVLGCKKDFAYQREVKCDNCEGHGRIDLDNGCKTCKGRGQITQKQGHMMFVQTCHTCRGRKQTKNCPSCNGEGIKEIEAKVNVAIPAGIENSSILRLSSMGNYAGSFMGAMDQYTDVHLGVEVKPDNEMKMENRDIVSGVSISLLQALTGCKKEIKTIDGMREIDIQPGVRHKEEVVLVKMGVARLGNHRVILDVSYPDRLDKLVGVLKGENN